MVDVTGSIGASAPSLRPWFLELSLQAKAIDYIYKGMIFLFYFSVWTMKYQIFPGTVGYVSDVSSIGTQPWPSLLPPRRKGAHGSRHSMRHWPSGPRTMKAFH